MKRLLFDAACGEDTCDGCALLDEEWHSCAGWGAVEWTFDDEKCATDHHRLGHCHAAEAAAKAPDMEPWRELAREIIRADRRAGDDVVAGGELEALANAASRLLGEP